MKIISCNLINKNQCKCHKQKMQFNRNSKCNNKVYNFRKEIPCNAEKETTHLVFRHSLRIYASNDPSWFPMRLFGPRYKITNYHTIFFIRKKLSLSKSLSLFFLIYALFILFVSVWFLSFPSIKGGWRLYMFSPLSKSHVLSIKWVTCFVHIYFFVFLNFFASYLLVLNRLNTCLFIFHFFNSFICI
jgi:hypothetical protein